LHGSHAKLLLADEQTGQLDLETGRTVTTLLRNLIRAEGVKAIVATNDPIMLDLTDRVVELRHSAWSKSDPAGKCRPASAKCEAWEDYGPVNRGTIEMLPARLRL
jgi:ABC-type transport system involved in cytochrome bd biosynthesis fused ATPase/permease subunit